MRIAHISDVHIRNHKYRTEYRAAFDDLYGQLRLIRPHLIINTGDLVHSKLAVSPELFDDVADHMLAMSEIAPYWLILGNHDLNLKNVARTDAISPIVRALQGRTSHDLKLLSKGMYRLHADSEFVFWNYDIRGHDDFTDTHVIDDRDVNIGLYHGSLSGCMTDMGFVMADGEASVSKFDAMDYVMLGDIHKQQSFRNGRVRYPGSLIQQNYGEELIKGFLVWEIDGKDEFSVEFRPVEAPNRFFTIQVPSTLDISGISVPIGSRIKALVEGGISPSKRLKLEEGLTRAFAPVEIITPDVSDERIGSEPLDVESLVGSREKMARDYLMSKGIDEQGMDAVLDLFRQYESSLDSDLAGRGTTWQLKNISWDNMMNYGEGNSIDLMRLPGLVGIFGPNAIGKSSIFDIILEALFDKVSKDVPRNIDLVNDNRDTGSMNAEFEAGGRSYSIERSIERISYGQRKLSETKQWGKTSLDFSSIDDCLNGTSRPETERAIRAVIGNFEDFVMTAMLSQGPIFGLPGGGDIMNCKETDRRKILFRFLDLDVYERIGVAARDDLKDLMGKLRELDAESLTKQRERLTIELNRLEGEILDHRSFLHSLESDLERIDRALAKANANDLQRISRERGELRTRRVTQQRQLAELSSKLESARKLLSQLCEKRLTHERIRPVNGPLGLDELHSRMTSLRGSRERNAAELSQSEHRLKQGMRSLKTLDGIPCGKAFPTCRFIAEAVAFEEQRLDIEDAVRTLSEEKSGCDAEFLSLEKFDVISKAFNAWKQRLSDIELEISRCEQGLTAIETDFRRQESELSSTTLVLAEYDLRLHESSLEEIRNLQDERRSIEKVASGLRVQIDSVLRSVGAIDSKIEAVSADIESIEGLAEKAVAHELLLEMCGKDGLPYKILSLVLPVINFEISKILSGIVKFSVFFEADTDEQTVSLFVRYGDYKSRPMSLGSGAEKFIASLAIRVALLSVSSLPKTDILIIDEGFGRLDPEHLEALQRMFEYLRNAFRSVFIVSHVDSMRDSVDHSIEITSRDGYAHVEVN